MRPPSSAAPAKAPTFDTSGTVLFRVWHPSPHTATSRTMRRYGPLYRLDHHPPGPTTAHAPDGPTVWYGSASLETGVHETFVRGADTVTICAAHRVSAVVIDSPYPTVPLDAAATRQRLGVPDDIGDDLDVDVDGYATTQAWARWLAGITGVDAARYWSARQRARTDRRHAINTVLWREPGEWREVARHRLTDDAVWAYVVVALDRAGVAWERMPRCGRC